MLFLRFLEEEKLLDNQAKYAIEMRNVTKTFGSVVANHNVNLDLREGEILALLGENGSGKTTLMNMLSGIYFPDSGEIHVHGKEVSIRAPKDAFDLGIGMIHQHFKLVDVLTAAENIVLGLPGGVRINRKALSEKIREISSRYGFDIDPDKKVYNMSVSEKQTVEIIKVLYRGADILILYEPTAVLTPQDTNKLFRILKAMKKDGKAIIIITHKMNEVLSVSDRVTILRKGEYIATVNTAEADKQSLTDMMVGHSVSLSIDRPVVEKKECRLSVRNLTCLSEDNVPAIRDVSFDAMGGEILGIAGIAGSGQKELCETLAGLYPAQPGSSIDFHRPEGGDEELVGHTAAELQKNGINISLAFVPEDRLGMGLVASLDMVDNLMLRTYRDHSGPFVDRKAAADVATRLVKELEIVIPGIHTPIRRLSGGNVQKVLLGREIEGNPHILVVAYPVRGLDINSSYTVYNLLNEQKKKGVSVIFIGEDLDVLMEISDRVMVLCGGEVSGIVDPRTTTKEEIGMMMVHVDNDRKENQA